jgi:uncharacterized protein (TIGR02271 family)
MRQTVVGAFDQYSAAQRAADYLASQGIERDHIHVQMTDEADSGYRSSETTTEGTEHGSRGVMASVRSFFSEVFGPDREHEDLHQYAETIKRGGAVVAVDVDEESQVTEVCRKLKNAGAIDLDQRVSEWRSTGWSGFDEGVSPAYAADHTSDTSMTSATGSTGTMTTGTAAMGTAAMGTAGMGATTAGMRTDTTEGRMMQEDVVPVVQEDLEIGKRLVEQGGIRVYTRVVEQPVRESVDLRSEHAVVERRPVDRPLTDADAAFQDRTIEVRETAEKAVVSKTAHVVEEVRIGKEVQHQTQEVNDTVRHTEVEVQRLDSGDLSSGLRSDAGYDAHALGYRDHFDRNYSHMGAVYDEYDPAYRYGHSLANDERYRGQDWDTMEPMVRRDWESRHGSSSGSTWDRMKFSVRHAWERAKS